MAYVHRLDHHSRFSISRIRKLPIGAVSLLFVRHRYEKPRGPFNDSDVLDLKTVVENNAHIGFN